MVQVKKNGKVVLELPEEDFPVDVEMTAISLTGAKKLRKFKLRVNFWSQPPKYEPKKEYPKGLQLT